MEIFETKRDLLNNINFPCFNGEKGEDQSFVDMWVADGVLAIFYGISDDDVRYEYDTWSDPGVYPSGAGGGPLADYSYPSSFEMDFTEKDFEVKLMLFSEDGEKREMPLSEFLEHKGAKEILDLGREVALERMEDEIYKYMDRG